MHMAGKLRDKSKVWTKFLDFGMKQDAAAETAVMDGANTGVKHTSSTINAQPIRSYFFIIACTHLMSETHMCWLTNNSQLLYT